MSIQILGKLQGVKTLVIAFLIAAIAVLSAAPGSVFGAAPPGPSTGPVPATDDVSFVGDTTVTLDGSGINLLILDGSVAALVSVSTSDIRIGTNSGPITLRSPDNYKLVNDGGINQCTWSGGYVQITLSGVEDVTFTPVAEVCSSPPSGGGGGTPSTTASTTPTVDLTDPAGGETLIPESFFDITWDIGGYGISTVKLEYSLDGGNTYALIADDIDDASSPYRWTVPGTATSKAKIKISAQDSGKAVLATDYSALFAIQTADGGEITVPGTETYPNGFPPGVNVAPNSGQSGPSPITGEIEDISVIEPGQFVRSSSLNPVYYVTSDLMRRPFWDGMSFFTWADNWDEVTWITDATLPTMSLGQPMLPKAGVVMVKIQSDPKVYWVEEDPVTGQYLLRWVTTEAIASSMFGANWADYIVDVNPTIFTHYGVGDDITFAETVDTSQMKTRLQIASQLAGM